MTFDGAGLTLSLNSTASEDIGDYYLVLSVSETETGVEASHTVELKLWQGIPVETEQTSIETADIQEE